jgi:hypothetical protein
MALRPRFSPTELVIICSEVVPPSNLEKVPKFKDSDRIERSGHCGRDFASYESEPATRLIPRPRCFVFHLKIYQSFYDKQCLKDWPANSTNL